VTGLYWTRRLPARVALRSWRRAFLSGRSMPDRTTRDPAIQTNAIVNTKVISISAPMTNIRTPQPQEEPCIPDPRRLLSGPLQHAQPPSCSQDILHRDCQQRRVRLGREGVAPAQLSTGQDNVRTGRRTPDLGRSRPEQHH
jgi:hypothetical protein